MTAKKIYRKINELIGVGDLNSALHAVKVMVETTINNRAYNGKILVSKKLDEFLEIINSRLSISDENDSIKLKKYEHIVVVTSFAGKGGHYQLLKSMVRRKLVSKNTLYVITDLFGDGDMTIEALKSVPHSENIKITGLDLIDKVNHVKKILHDYDCKKIFLFTHNQDVVGVVSALSANRLVSYIHHADHTLSLGCTIKKFKHIDLHNTAFFSCRYKYRIDNSFLPLTVSRKRKCIENNNEHPKILTLGNKSKFSGLIDGVEYPEFIVHLLVSTCVEYHHIGDLNKKDIELIYAKLKSFGVDEIRFIHNTYIDDIEDYVHLKKIDAFLVSVPISGSLAMIEAMSMGLPLICFKNSSSIYSSGLDWAYENSFKWSEINELTEFLSNYKEYDIKNERVKSYSHYLRYHDEFKLKSIIEVPYQSIPCIQPLSDFFDDDILLIDKLDELSFERDFVYSVLSDQIKKLNNKA